MWTSTLLSAVLVINELMASNVGDVMSPAVNFDSWIEIYNPSEQAINLGGMYLSNDANDLMRWQMPSNMGTVPAGGYKVIWLGSNDIKIGWDEEEVGKLQAPFKLDCDGGTIYLSDKSGELIISQEYPESMSHSSWARKTDGGEEWGWTNDFTPGQSNATAKFATERLDAPVVSVASRLFTNSLNVKVNIPEGATLLYTTDGSLPKIESPWKEMLSNGNCEGTDATCFVSRDGDGNGDVNRILDGVGFEGSRGIKVHSIANAPNDWKTQFFVYTPDHIWKTNERYRFRMRVKADKACKISVQAHRTPGDYITNGLLGSSVDVTTEWTEFTYEGVVTKEQADEQTSGGGGGGGWGGWGGGGWGGWNPQVTTYALQTIAFNLNTLKDTDNNFYFDDISWETYEDISSQESKDGNFAISNTTNLTVRLFKDGYLPSVPVTRSYIKTNNNYTLPIISIVGDTKFFNDQKIGFDCEGDGTNGALGNGQNQPRNYNQDWDRPANFSYISPDGEMQFNQDVNISASGGWTRSQRFRSFKLKSNKIFDGQNRFDFSFFPQKPYTRNKALLIRNGGNDFWVHNARFMDPALETIIQRSGIDIDVQSYVPIIEYVNGELRGVLNMREVNNDKFAYANWGYDDEELDAFENMKMKNGDAEVINRIFELGRNATNESAYEELKTLLDIDEFTNYMAVTMFLDNDDWPNNNIKAYRSRNDGRYRFVSFDLDYAFALRGFNRDNDDPFTYFLRFKDAETVYDEGNANREIVRLFLNLMGRDDYRRKFIDTFCLMGGSVFEPTRAGVIVDELLNNVTAMCQLMRQQGINEGHEPKRAADEIKSKLKGRSKKMAGFLKKFSYAQLSTTAQEVALNASVQGAHIYINGLDVPYAEFNGHLFAPVKLSAKAPAGYRFAGWKKDNTIVSTDEEINLPSDNTVSLTATFRALSDDERLKKDITPVRINEVSAANGIYVNEYFKRNDWIELYNTTSKPIDVKGMYLSDNLEKPHKYQIGEAVDAMQSTLILPYSYLVVWCDKLDPLSQLHTSFKLAAEGGDVLLSAKDDSWCDRFTYAEHKSDETVGRYPDGTNNVIVMNVPTIGKTNCTSSYAVAIEQAETAGIQDLLADNSASLSMLYASGKLIVRGQADEKAKVNIFSNAGQMVATFAVQLNGGFAEISVEGLPTGYYVAEMTNQQGDQAVCKFVKR
ncbi:MAG: lamin tail domain-containing protein [Prevotella sp.]|nr:lamin tail domain-containing protein [Prevotella sp.]